MMTEVAELLRRAGKVLLAAHREPDGDALGATLGLLHLLEAAGKQAVAYSAGPVPEEYRFLPGVERLGHDLPGDCDLAVLLDCHEPQRSGPESGPLLAAHGNVAVIDHHQGRPEFGRAIWVDPSYAATCVMLVDLAWELGWAMGREAAMCLFVGIQTDTGSFRYSNTSPRALRCAAQLVEAGADPWAASQEVYATKPVRLKLLGRIMDRLDLRAGGKLAMAAVSQDDLAALGALPSDLEQAVEAIRGIAGVEAAALLKQMPGGEVKASLRSRGRVDVSAVARSLGGGGHRNAAGARLQGGLDQAARRLREILLPLVEAL